MSPHSADTDPFAARPRDWKKSLVGGSPPRDPTERWGVLLALAKLVRLGDNLTATKYFQQCQQAWEEHGEPCIIDGKDYVWEMDKTELLLHVLSKGHFTQTKVNKKGRTVQPWLFRNSVFLAPPTAKLVPEAGVPPTQEHLRSIGSTFGQIPLPVLYSIKTRGIVESTEAFQTKLAEIRSLMGTDDPEILGDLKRAVCVHVYCEGEWMKWIHWDELADLVDELAFLAPKMEANKRTFRDFFGAEDTREAPMLDFLMAMLEHTDEEHLKPEFRGPNGAAALRGKALEIVAEAGGEDTKVCMGDFKYLLDKLDPDEEVKMICRNGKAKTFPAAKDGGTMEERFDHLTKMKS